MTDVISSTRVFCKQTRCKPVSCASVPINVIRQNNVSSITRRLLSRQQAKIAPGNLSSTRLFWSLYSVKNSLKDSPLKPTSIWRKCYNGEARVAPFRAAFKPITINYRQRQSASQNGEVAAFSHYLSMLWISLWITGSRGRTTPLHHLTSA